MQNIDRQHALVDLMLQEMQELSGYVALYVDGERNATEATLYMMRRLGVDMSKNNATREEANEAADKLANINFAPPHFAVSSLQKLRTHSGKKVAVYVSTPLNTDAKNMFAGLASADRLVFMTV